jgi:hypothetical protein
MFDEAFLRKLERLAILSRKAVAGQLQGERRSPKRGQSVEFADFRPYASGDDFRRIDWNAYARLERFFIKLFVEEQDLNVHLLIDTSRSMDWGQPNKLDYAVRTAGALGYISLAGLDRVTVTALGGQKGGDGASSPYFPPHRGKNQAFALFSFLQSIRTAVQMTPNNVRAGFLNTPVYKKVDNKPAPTQNSSVSTQSGGNSTGLAPRLRSYATTAHFPGPLLLFSDLMDEGWADGLRALGGRGFEVSVLHLLSPDELNPQITGDLKLIDVENGADVELTADFDLLARYRSGLAAWQEEIRLFCGARGMHYVPVDTSLPFEELLFAWMRRQGVLK